MQGLHAGDLLVTDVTDDVVDNAHVNVQMSKTAAKSTTPQQSGPQQNNMPPGGSSQYGNQSITDSNMQGQQGQQNQKQANQGKARRAQTARGPASHDLEPHPQLEAFQPKATQ